MTTTVAQAHRQLVAEMDEAGDSPEEIATKLGISVDRVEAILDQLDGVEHLEPVAGAARPAAESAPVVVGSPARAPKTKPAVEVRPVPDPDPDPAPSEEVAAGEPTPVLASRAAELSIALAAAPPPPEPVDPPKSVRGTREHGTAKGARQHWGHGETPCEPCREAYNAEHRVPQESAKRTGPAPCGTQAAYKRHLRKGEKPCEPCRQAHSEYMAAYNGKPALDRPEGAVAHLSLPLSVPALVAVADALELAYGPDLRVEAAEGGLWVLRRAS